MDFLRFGVWGVEEALGFAPPPSEGRRKLKSDVVTELRFELRRSEVVWVELRLEGEVELERLLAFGSCRGESKGFPFDSMVKSSILAQFDWEGMRDRISSWLSTLSRPFCLRVGLGLGLMGLGRAPGGNTAFSGLKSKAERFSLGIEVR